MLKIALCFFMVLFSSFSFAAGGLEAGTDLLKNIKTWGYGFIGVGALCYVLYNVAMALMERKQWSDVAMAVVYSAIAGGCIIAAEYAHDIWS